MRRAVRRVWLTAAIAVLAVAGSGAHSTAAIAPQNTIDGVASIQPANGQVVGVAHPVIVTFIKPVNDRAAAERAIKITTSNHTTGRFSWVDDNIVQWTPNGYWPARSHVGVQVHALGTGFETGDAVVGVASISQHTFTVSINGEVVRTMPASMGKPSRPTPIGNYTALSKERTVVMDSRTIGIPLSSPEGYKITASYAVRVTWSGVYVHSAPWSVDSQGYANVSHGCINLSPENAEWYFDTVHVGDPINVVE
ncbi:MAG: L,D-transpeptidase [Mycobacterium sp.]|nr:L,D-transpeptidase [Mycobacterium sp.]MBV9722215.1 L,D-transpeptidase [Mycobacterium sp.]